MSRKWRWVMGLIGLVLTIGCFYYWFHMSHPSVLPTDEQIIKEINDIYLEADAKEVQDRVAIDELHFVIPYISGRGDYSLSYWEWGFKDWSLTYIDTKGEPTLWHVDPAHPSTYHIVWNFDPRDQVDEISYYLLRDRGFYVSEGVENYQPQIQIEKKITLQNQTYGVMKLPEEFVETMEGLNRVTGSHHPFLSVDEVLSMQQMYMGYFPMNKDGKRASIDYSVNGQGFSNGTQSFDFVMPVNERDLEVPK
ncbi:hypothetical protein [Bacillus weihaiensis]|uniref:hypothetical protein n=1 Tax=Bacillus weihaiensis TaxID=1547283 RepID=UPI00235347F8|nr:hypothetical protein [Bacillus weihaiensis]